MKSKLILTIALLATYSFSAQDLTSKRGENFLPEEGEWAIGLDAAPFLNYAGNLFNSGNTNPVANFPNSINTIYGKMFITPTSAYRAKIRIGFNSVTNRAFTEDATDPMATVEDTEKVSSTFIGIGAGMEKRRGNSRLQGVYGAEAFIWFSGQNRTYEYGNELTATNTTNSNAFDPIFDGVTESNSGSTFGIQLRGFLGAEYFILPKISLGAEYGWGLAFSSAGDGETTSEFHDGTGVQSETTASAGGSSVSLDTDINNAIAAGGVLGAFSLKALFHF